MTPEAAEALKRSAEAPERAGRSDLGAVAQDLSAAFATDPVMNWFLRADAQRDAGRLRLFHLLMASAFADGEIVRPAAGGAAAVWLPSESLGPTPFLQEMRALPTLLAATGFLRIGRMAATRRAMEAHHPKDRPHAYLWFIGVRPEAQGLGVGSRLLAASLRRLDAEGRPAYLESSNIANVPLYRRHGFEVTAEIEPRPGSPKLYAMWREPQA
ncbi:MAG: GNAT family N-acetyltransferase [Phenylobacterium sp.]|uniref:GNAT family N-acetyltransferase n=1 Tax=Phenylobacterium sp. TaxID=1871053 RepID=UPI00391B9339